MAPRQGWPLLLAASIAQFGVELDFLAVSLALPSMARELHVSVTDLQWALSGYMLAFGALLVVGGRLGDVFGRRRLLLTGLAAFAAGAAACGSVSSAGLVVAFRVLQGLGAAIIMPMAVAVVTNAFPAERRDRALGVVFGVAGVGTAIGPFLGGVLTSGPGWRWVFWILVPVAAVAFALVRASARESWDESAPRSFDLAGAAVLSGGLVLISLGVDRGQSWHWLSAGTLAVLALGAGLLAAFPRLERRVHQPLLDPALTRNRGFITILAAGTLCNAAFATTVFLSTLYLQRVRDLSPVLAGLVFLAPALSISGSSLITGRLAERMAPARIMALASGLGGAALLALTWARPWALYVPVFFLWGLGMGLAWTYTTIGTQKVVPSDQTGSASGVTLMVLVSAGGVAVSLAATLVEVLQRPGGSLGWPIDAVLRGVAVSLLACSVLYWALAPTLGTGRTKPRRGGTA